MRVAREIVVGVAYHLIWRFVDREWFFADDLERAVYLRLLGRALDKSDWRCTAYALMSNHIHLSAIAGVEDLEHWAKRVSSPFARWMNERHGRLGSVMADRPASHAFGQARECQLIAYIHNNPVRAGVAKAARDSTWTSHRFYAGLATAPHWLDVALGAERTGIEIGDEFDRWVMATPGESGDIAMRAIRKVARRRGAIEVATPSNGAVVPLVGRPFGHVRPEPLHVVRVAAVVTGLAIDVIRSRQRSAGVSLARSIVVHCALRAGVTGADIAACLGISPGRVSQIRSEAVSSCTTQRIEMALRRLEIDLGVETKSVPIALQKK
jgi:REP element-mobilizing transposase RayT